MLFVCRTEMIFVHAFAPARSQEGFDRKAAEAIVCREMSEMVNEWKQRLVNKYNFRCLNTVDIKTPLRQHIIRVRIKDNYNEEIFQYFTLTSSAAENHRDNGVYWLMKMYRWMLTTYSYVLRLERKITILVLYSIHVSQEEHISLTHYKVHYSSVLLQSDLYMLPKYSWRLVWALIKGIFNMVVHIYFSRDEQQHQQATAAAVSPVIMKKKNWPEYMK